MTRVNICSKKNEKPTKCVKYKFWFHFAKFAQTQKVTFIK